MWGCHIACRITSCIAHRIALHFSCRIGAGSVTDFIKDRHKITLKTLQFYFSNKLICFGPEFKLISQQCKIVIRDCQA